MNSSLQGYAAAVAGSLGEPERAELADGVAAVDRLVAGNAAMRAAMTDMAVPGEARRAVLEDLLQGKVGAATRRLCGFAVRAVHAQEVPAALGWLAHRLRVLVAGGPVTEEPLGHREARARVGGYATAVLEELSLGELENVEDELFRFSRTVASVPQLRSALGDRDLPVAVRRGVVDDLLEGKVAPATKRLADYAVTGGRPRDIVGTLAWLAERVAVARGWRVARVRSGQDVDASERRKLEETLARLAGNPVELQVTVEPALLAGVDVEIGDLRLDATARGRLERLREHVTGGAWTDLGFGRTERTVQDRTRSTGADGS